MRVIADKSSALIFVLGLAVWAGCSNEEKLHRVSGVVTHNGQPIPKGVIRFVPRKDGPQGFANIVGGKYDTAQGKGVRGGSYEVLVNGFNGIEAPEAPFGQGLFPEYTGTKELPAEDSTFDLDVRR